MKLNEEVILLQDGKICRSTIGVVVAKTKYKVRVTFPYRGKYITAWFRPYGNTRQFRNTGRYGGYVQEAEHPICNWFSVNTFKSIRRITISEYYIDLARNYTEGHKDPREWEDE